MASGEKTMSPASVILPWSVHGEAAVGACSRFCCTLNSELPMGSPPELAPPHTHSESFHAARVVMPPTARTVPAALSAMILRARCDRDVEVMTIPKVSSPAPEKGIVRQL